MMTVSQFREITGIRINLEGLATAPRPRLLDEAALSGIEALHERFSREIALKRPDKNPPDRVQQGIAFRHLPPSRMPMLLQMIESLWLRIGPILNYDLRSGRRA